MRVEREREKSRNIYKIIKGEGITERKKEKKNGKRNATWKVSTEKEKRNGYEYMIEKKLKGEETQGKMEGRKDAKTQEEKWGKNI